MAQFNPGEWIEHGQRLLAYQREALEFLSRVRQQFPLARRSHAREVAALWMAADGLDETLYRWLEEIKDGLLSGQGSVDTTRGVGVMPLGEDERLYYNCTWLLEWGDRQALAVDLIVDPEAQSLSLQVAARQAREATTLRYPPLDESALKEALLRLLAAEATSSEYRELDTPNVLGGASSPSQ